jgi:hypothetical protein
MAVTRFPGTLSGAIYVVDSFIGDVALGIAETVVQTKIVIPARSRVLGLGVNHGGLSGTQQISAVLGTGTPSASNRIIPLTTLGTTADSPQFIQAVADTAANLLSEQFDIKVDGVKIKPSQIIPKNSLLTVRAVTAAGTGVGIAELRISFLLFTDLRELDATD